LILGRLCLSGDARHPLNTRINARNDPNFSMGAYAETGRLTA